MKSASAFSANHSIRRKVLSAAFGRREQSVADRHAKEGQCGGGGQVDDQHSTDGSAISPCEKAMQDRNEPGDFAEGIPNGGVSEKKRQTETGEPAADRNGEPGSRD